MKIISVDKHTQMESQKQTQQTTVLTDTHINSQEAMNINHDPTDKIMNIKQLVKIFLAGAAFNLLLMKANNAQSIILLFIYILVATCKSRLQIMWKCPFS